MATVNPRISVTLQPQVAAMLKRLSELTGNSQSALIGELLTASVEVFERMVTMLDAAAKLKAEGLQVSQEIKAGMEQAHKRIEHQLGLVLDDFDAGGGPLIEAAERLGRRATRTGPRAGRAAASGGPAAPMSNRGVTPQGKAVKARAKKGVTSPSGA